MTPKAQKEPTELAATAKFSSAARGRRVLYLTYDGLTDPLGRSQILPYLKGLAARGHDITVISCEKAERSSADGQTVRRICEQAGIDWHALRFHARPPVLSSIIDVLQMKHHATTLFRRDRFDLVHCRSYMAALVGHSLKQRFGVPFLFDMRGFWADERIERGFWPTGNPLFAAAYRFFKRREVRFFRDADAIVSLTNSARREVESWPDPRRPRAPIHVIPCCVDLELFDPAGEKARAAGRERLGLSHDQPVLLYVGSLGAGYVINAMFRLFRVFRTAHPGARYLFVSNHSRVEVLALARPFAIDPDEIITIAGRREEMPELIAAGDIGVAFLGVSYSSKASSPTKIGEMLAMGVPVIATGAVGDNKELLDGTTAGAVVERYDDESLAAAIRKIERAGMTVEQVRAVASHRFALEDGVKRYEAIYRSIGARRE